MPQGDGASNDTLRRILQLEAARGYADDAVLGGLEAFVVPNAPRLQHVAAGYGAADHFARQRIVERLREAIDNEDDDAPSTEVVGDPASLLRPVSDAIGVGAKRADALANLGILTIEDLLTHLPRRIEDRTAFKAIGALRPGDQVCVLANVTAISHFRVHRRMEAVKAALEDGTGILYAVWFNQPWIAKQLKKGLSVVVYGRVERNYGELQISSPLWEPEGDRMETGRWVPIYPGTEKAGDRYLRTTIRRTLDRYLSHVQDLLPADLIAAHNLLPRRAALRALHVPSGPEAFERARRSLAFEELFLLHIGLGRTHRRKEGATHGGSGALPTSFLAALPFRLTDSQRTALREIAEELGSTRRMMRLLQGDVGSGKTIVALLAALHAIEGEHQVAFMVPTEILAEQHASRFTELLEGLPVTVGLLSGSAASNRAVQEAIASGEIDLAVGTHALIQEAVSFPRLGLVVIDEQHRFGVVQRSAIEEKGQDVDLLVMSATPIPRTLALTLYGEFDVSTLEELPCGEKRTETVWVSAARRNEVYASVAKELDAGGRGYVILPLVEESEKLDLNAATDVATELRDRFPEHGIGLIHGRLPAAERAQVMERFRAGELHLLVATTVIEVGIDVPDANIMVIEHAERFGLSQLHQLRGRIGRTGQPAVCYALAAPGTEDARLRLEAFSRTDDGFALAEEDLRIRGPGDLLGTKQHGFFDSLRAVNLLADLDLMESSRRAARAALKAPVEKALLEVVERRFGEMLRWLQV